MAAGAFVKPITRKIEMLDIFRAGQFVLSDVAAHQTAGFLGEETDDLVNAVFLVFKNRRDDPGIE